MAKKRHKSGGTAAKSRRTKGKTGCQGCPSLCCRDMVAPIDKPKNRFELDELKWQLQYDTIRVFIVSRRWHLLAAGRCMHLTQKNWCRIYEDRPQKCRVHNPPDCEHYGEFWDVMFNTPDELEAYMEKERKKRLRKRRKRAALERAAAGRA